jgi:translation elongation factor EF-G
MDPRMPTAVISIVVTPTTSVDQAKLIDGLQVMSIEDETLRMRMLPRRGIASMMPFIIAGTSDEHLEAIVERLAREFGVNAAVSVPQIIYHAEDADAIREPVMDVEIDTPEEYVGDILGDLNRRHGRMVSMDRHDASAHLHAHVPMADLMDYRRTLRYLTRQRASHHIRFHHYEHIERGPGPLDDDRFLPIGAPRRPTLPRKGSAIAVPEPEDYWLES